ncbi:MAG: hypothetical protein RLZZ211_1279 [Bacteroidota bacterium]|jgi:hypothetical protein
MRVLIVFVVLNSFCNCSFTTKIMKNKSNNEVKELLIGKWILTTDDEYVIDIKEDEIKYFYKGKIDERNPIDFVFYDSLEYYKTKSNAFDFMKDGELHSMVELIEYANQGKDTVVNTIIYIDKNGMDLIRRNRSASFRKLE